MVVIPISFSFSFQEQEANRALRLKDESVREERASGSQALDTRLTWNYFDERSYIERGRLLAGEDPYRRNKFNQAESDKLRSNRDIPDTRHPM